jgi:hypothetical protein
MKRRVCIVRAASDGAGSLRVVLSLLGNGCSDTPLQPFGVIASLSRAFAA